MPVSKARDIILKIQESQEGFTTEVREVDVTGFDYESIDVRDASATIRWEADFDMRSYGIKDLSVVITGVTAHWTPYSVAGDDDVPMQPGKLQWNGDKQFTAEVEYSHREGSSFSLFPSKVEIHLIEKRIVVMF